MGGADQSSQRKPRFHDFYEGKYVWQIRHLPGSSVWRDWAFFNLVQSGLMGEIDAKLRPGSLVVELACGGGVAWLARRARTVGVNIAFHSARAVAEVYALGIQADVQELPLRDSCADLVWGSYFFEHLLADEKDRCLEEIRRVLRPGGACILQFDVLSANRLSRFAARDPERFERGFVENDGHVGLEPLPEALDRVTRSGLVVTTVRKFGATPLQYLATYNWLALGYADSHRWVRWLGSLTRLLARSKAGLLYEFAVTFFDRTVDRFVKPEMATRAIVSAVKPE